MSGFDPSQRVVYNWSCSETFFYLDTTKLDSVLPGRIDT